VSAELGNTFDDGIKTFVGGEHALAGMYDHESASRVLTLAKQPGSNFSELCKWFQISRKTGYKWQRRTREASAAGQANHSRRPQHSPRQSASSIDARAQFSDRARERRSARNFD
jgi:transposase